MKFQRNIFPVALIFGFLMLLWRGNDAQTTVYQSLYLCGKVLIPSLFPYLVLSRLYVSVAHETPTWIQRPLSTMFGLSKAGCSAVLIGAVGGYPAGATAIAQLYQKKSINRTEAERLLFFACNCGPAFCCSVIGIGLYGSLTLGFLLYGITLVSSMLCGWLFTWGHQQILYEQPQEVKSPPPFMTEFVSAVSQSVQGMLQICGFVGLFSLLLSLEKTIFHSGLFYVIAAGLTELSGGVFALNALDISWSLKFSLTAAITTFGGACVVMQTGAFLLPAGLSIKPYLCGKLLQGLLAGILAWPVSYLFQGTKSVALFPAKIVAVSPWPWCILSILLTFLIFLKIPTGKNGTHPL